MLLTEPTATHAPLRSSTLRLPVEADLSRPMSAGEGLAWASDAMMHSVSAMAARMNVWPAAAAAWRITPVRLSP